MLKRAIVELINMATNVNQIVRKEEKKVVKTKIGGKVSFLSQLTRLTSA